MQYSLYLGQLYFSTHYDEIFRESKVAQDIKSIAKAHYENQSGVIDDISDLTLVGEGGLDPDLLRENFSDIVKNNDSVSAARKMQEYLDEQEGYKPGSDLLFTQKNFTDENVVDKLRLPAPGKWTSLESEKYIIDPKGEYLPAPVTKLAEQANKIMLDALKGNQLYGLTSKFEDLSTTFLNSDALMKRGGIRSHKSGASTLLSTENIFKSEAEILQEYRKAGFKLNEGGFGPADENLFNEWQKNQLQMMTRYPGIASGDPNSPGSTGWVGRIGPTDPLGRIIDKAYSKSGMKSPVLHPQFRVGEQGDVDFDPYTTTPMPHKAINEKGDEYIASFAGNLSTKEGRTAHDKWMAKSLEHSSFEKHNLTMERMYPNPETRLGMNPILKELDKYAKGVNDPQAEIDYLSQGSIRTRDTVGTDLNRSSVFKTERMGSTYNTFKRRIERSAVMTGMGDEQLGSLMMGIAHPYQFSVDQEESILEKTKIENLLTAAIFSEEGKLVYFTDKKKGEKTGKPDFEPIDMENRYPIDVGKDLSSSFIRSMLSVPGSKSEVIPRMMLDPKSSTYDQDIERISADIDAVKDNKQDLNNYIARSTKSGGDLVMRENSVFTNALVSRLYNSSIASGNMERKRGFEAAGKIVLGEGISYTPEQFIEKGQAIDYLVNQSYGAKGNPSQRSKEETLKFYKQIAGTDVAKSASVQEAFQQSEGVYGLPNPATTDPLFYNNKLNEIQVRKDAIEKVMLPPKGNVNQKSNKDSAGVPPTNNNVNNAGGDNPNNPVNPRGQMGFTNYKRRPFEAEILAAGQIAEPEYGIGEMIGNMPVNILSNIDKSLSAEGSAMGIGSKPSTIQYVMEMIRQGADVEQIVMGDENIRRPIQNMLRFRELSKNIVGGLRGKGKMGLQISRTLADYGVKDNLNVAGMIMSAGGASDQDIEALELNTGIENIAKTSRDVFNEVETIAKQAGIKVNKRLSGKEEDSFDSSIKREEMRLNERLNKIRLEGAEILKTVGDSEQKRNDVLKGTEEKTKAEIRQFQRKAIGEYEQKLGIDPSMSEDQRLNAMMADQKRGGSYQRLVSDYAARTEQDALPSGGKDAKGVGSLRRMLGGFGLMYFRSALSMAAGGLYGGYEEQMQLRQELGQQYAQMYGGEREATSAEQISIAKAVQMRGSGGQVLSEIQKTLMQQAPATFQTFQAGVTGLAVGGMMQFAGSSMGLPEVTTNKMMAISGSLAFLGTNAARAYSMQQDPLGTSTALYAQRSAGGDPLMDALGSTAIAAAQGAVYGGLAGSQLAVVGAVPGALIGAGIGAISGFTSTPYAAELFSGEIQRDEAAIKATIESGLSMKAVNKIYDITKTEDKREQFIATAEAIKSKNPQFSTEAITKYLYTADKNSIPLSDKNMLSKFAALYDRGIDITQVSEGVLKSSGYTPLQFEDVIGQTMATVVTTTTVSGGIGERPSTITNTNEVLEDQTRAGKALEDTLSVFDNLSPREQTAYIKGINISAQIGNKGMKQLFGDVWRNPGLRIGKQVALGTMSDRDTEATFDSMQSIFRAEAAGYKTSGVIPPEIYNQMSEEQRIVSGMETQLNNQRATAYDQQVMQYAYGSGNDMTIEQAKAALPQLAGADPYELAVFGQKQSMASGIMTQLTRMGVGDMTSYGALTGMDYGQLRRLQGGLSMDPASLARMGQRGESLLDFGSIQNWMYTTEIDAQGQLTGQPLFSTFMGVGVSGQSGYQSPENIASSIWGADWASNDQFGLRDAAVNGVTIPGDTTGRTYAGLQGMQVQNQLHQFANQRAGLGIQYAQLQATAAFTTGVGLNAYSGITNPQTGQPFDFGTGSVGFNIPGVGGFMSQGGGFWGIQDAQRALGNVQQQWQFDFAQRKFDTGEQQWQESRGLARQQDLKQREWAKEDFAYNDQVRDLQWGWKQEDFAESVRFQTGRQRKLSERDMKRATIMHDLEGNRLEEQQRRQEEIWDAQDERFDMETRHHEEMKQFEIESMEKQREFYAVRKQLEEEYTQMQRAYWVQQQEFSKQQLGLQAQQIALQEEYWKNSMELNREREEREKTFRNRSMEFLDAVELRLEEIIKLLGGTVSYGDSTSSNGGTVPINVDTTNDRAGGGFIVGELGPERIERTSLGDYVTPNFAINPWSGESYTEKSSSKPGKMALVLKIGDEHIKTIILDTVSQEISL